MPMEQETMGLLIAGFSSIMGVAFIIVLRLLFSKNRKLYRPAYGMVLVYLVFFSLAVIQVLNAIKLDINHPMASEEISLKLGIAGVLWAISMLFLMLGLVKFSINKKTLKKDLHVKSKKPRKVRIMSNVYGVRFFFSYLNRYLLRRNSLYNNFLNRQELFIRIVISHCHTVAFLQINNKRSILRAYNKVLACIQQE